MLPIAHRGVVAVAISTAFTGLAFFTFLLRFYSQCFIIRALFIEDYLAIFAMLFSSGFTICVAVQAAYGMGHHIKELDVYDMESSLKAFWVSLSCYYLSLTFIKLSVILQYKRVFVSKRFQQACWVLILVVLAYGIWTVIGSVFACRPISTFWTRRKPASCFNQYICNAAMNIVTDFAIIILPMPVVRTLQLARKQKYTLIGIFAVGGVVCLVSILRLHSLIAIANSTDPTYTNTPAAIWTSVEINVGIICAYLPALRPLVSRAFPAVFASTTNEDLTIVSRKRNTRPYRGNSLALNNMVSKKVGSVCSDEEKLAGRIEVTTEVHLRNDRCESIAA